MAGNDPIFRVRFDVPHTFAVEPGYTRSTHCFDLRPLAGSQANVWREPMTGMMMLRPSFLDERWYDPVRWIPLTSWTVNADYWNQITRVYDPDAGTALAAFFTSSLKGDASSDAVPGLPAGTLNIFLASLVSIYLSDTLVWAGLSTVTLARDEGFVWHYRIQTDELHRHRNWFCLNIDDFLFHFSMDGTCRVYQYGSDKTLAPTLLEEFEVCSPGDISNKDGYFIFIPIPGYGMSIIHSNSPQALAHQTSSARAASVRGKLVKLPPKYTGAGKAYVHNGGNLAFGIMPKLGFLGYQFGCHRIRYPSSGSYVDAAFDPGYQPGSNAASTYEPLDG